jgi:hypothetical protein
VVGTRSTYTYDVKNNMLSFVHEGWSNDHWVNIFRNTRTYDANNRELSSLNEWWKNDQWVNSTRNTCTYDEFGNLLTYVSEDWADGQWAIVWRHTYTYNTNNDVLTRLFEEWAGGHLFNVSRDATTYDEQGNVVSFCCYSFNGSWIQADYHGGTGYELFESADNLYSLGSGYEYTLTHLLVVKSVVSEDGKVPANPSLSQNYPNPFNPVTKIHYALPISGRVCLKVYSVLGQEVATLVDEVQDVGFKSVAFDATQLTSGVYYYRIAADNFTQTRKMVLLK